MHGAYNVKMVKDVSIMQVVVPDGNVCDL
jgi:hypothetical protein